MKKIFLFLLIPIVLSCNSQVPKELKLVNALSDLNINQRGQIHKIDNEYRLDFYDVYEKDSHMKYLGEKKYQGGGPSWLGIIYGSIKLSDEKLLKQVRFDDESDGIAIWSSNKKVLEKIGRLISVVKSNEKLLLKSISIAEKDSKME